jgi:molecular chaperone GrpE
MADQHKNGPINIPIVSKDDDTPLESQGGADEDDVIEIDGDAVDLDAELAAAEAAMEDAEREPAAPADDASAGEPKGAEISREAVFELMQELRQKSEQVVRLTDEKNDLYDRLLRRQAEFENFRKRNEREMQEIYGRARSDVIADLLTVFDNFELALRHADSASAESFREGVQLIYKQLMDSLTRLGLEPIDAEDQPFDPELHEAVATETREDVPDHTVVFVLQRGFKLGDRLLRPARVKVAVQP